MEAPDLVAEPRVDRGDREAFPADEDSAVGEAIDRPGEGGALVEPDEEGSLLRRPALDPRPVGDSADPVLDGPVDSRRARIEDESLGGGGDPLEERLDGRKASAGQRGEGAGRLDSLEDHG